MSYTVTLPHDQGYRMGSMNDHFSRIASDYHHLRTTDTEPISLMAQKLDLLPSVKAADIGCGDGRYDQILCRELGRKLLLTCVDSNADMLRALDKNLREGGIGNYAAIQSAAEKLPLPDNSFDCIFTLNSVHHFDLARFVQQSTRVLKEGGYLFIYTRLRDQNKRNIWGAHFPDFIQKETRLYTLGAITKALDSVRGMWLQSIEYFKYGRLASLIELERKVRSHHYSTFFLYTLDELEKAIDQFRDNINRVYQDIQRIRWYDENVLFVARKVDQSA